VTLAQRLPFRVVVAWLVVACLLGWWISVGMGEAKTGFDEKIVMAILNVHTLCANIALGTMLLALIAASGSQALSRPIGALVGIAALIPFAVFFSPLLPAAAGLRVLVVVATLVALVGFISARERWAVAGLTSNVLAWTLVALGEAGAAMATWADMRISPLAGAMTELLLVAGVAVVAEPIQRERPRPAQLAAMVVLAASAYRSLLPEHQAAGAVLHAIAALVTLCYAAAGLGSRWPARLSAWTARLALLLFLEAVLARSFLELLVAVDSPLHDTMFEGATAHLEGLSIVLAVMASWFRDRESPRWLRAVPPVGLALVGAGAHVFCWSLLYLGMRGMPRGYPARMPEFQSMHTLMVVGATLLVVGIALAALTVRRKRSPPIQATVFD